MKRTFCGVILVLASRLACAEQSNQAEFEERFRAMVWQSDDINIEEFSRVPSKAERLLEMARQTGVSRSEAQTLLLKLVDEGMEVRGDEDRVKKQGTAKNALSVLGDVADASALDRIVNVAKIAPRELLVDAVRAATKTATREQPTELPAIVHDLLQGSAQDHVFGLLHDALRNNMPEDIDARSQRRKIIVGLFKEGLRNPNYEDRIYLDSVVEEFDPEFRQSEERKRILLDLGKSTNLVVKRYAEEKLRKFFHPSLGDSSVSAAIGQVMATVERDPDKKTEPDAQPSELETEKPTLRPWLWGFGVAGVSMLALIMLWIKRR